MKNNSRRFFLCAAIMLLGLCKTAAQTTQQQANTFLNDSIIATGHVGISIYEPATGKYLYNYNAEKNFIPSSNVKLFSLYAGLKYLGDSLVGAKIFETADSIFFEPTGDPTLLHKDFKNQPLFDKLSLANKNISLFTKRIDHFEKYGAGWAWDDSNEDFMPERNRFPIYGNVFTFFKEGGKILSIPPKSTTSKYMGEMNSTYNGYFKVKRSSFEFDWNIYFTKSDKLFTYQEIPFPTNRLYHDQILLLADTLKRDSKKIEWLINADGQFSNLYSRPVDSLFKPMMFNSDNFFAEQTLLMASNEKLGYMSDEEMIDTLLKIDLKDIPTKPRWVDGSGLSRYNLFSPKDFIYILDKLQKEFGLARMKRILPTAGQGTLRGYYEKDAGFIYAKTGSMTNNVSLSGYLITKQSKLLLFSIIINNYSGSGRAGRKAIEKFIQGVRLSN
ncbi:MAG: D-alanyl-D-alanine carboxypeptidase [Ferruginibacter sp.]